MLHKSCKMFDNEVFGQLFVKLFVLLPRAQHRKSPCLNTQTPDSLERYRQVQKKSCYIQALFCDLSLERPMTSFTHQKKSRTNLRAPCHAATGKSRKASWSESAHIWRAGSNATSNRRTRAEPSSAHQPHQKHHAPVHETNRRHFRDTKNAPPLT